MTLLGTRQLSVVLVGTLLLCHGVFGALHLLCNPPQCASDAEHQPAAGAVGDPHEHPAGHETSTGYFAVLAVGFLGLLVGLLLRSAPLRIGLGMRQHAILRLVPAVLRPPPTPTPLTLRVLRL